VLMYNAIPGTSNANADYALGQANKTSCSSGTASQSVFGGVYALSTQGSKLFVGDNLANRVLIYNTIPNADGKAADVVVGQSTFAGTSQGNAATSLSAPVSAVSDGAKLYVADSGNNRIYIYNSVPSGNGAAADLVLGQSYITYNMPSLSPSAQNLLPQ